MRYRKSGRPRVDDIKVMLAAGGSGGHIFPCVSLASELEKAGVKKLFFVSSKRQLDRNLLKDIRYPCNFFSINPMPSSFSVKGFAVFGFKCVTDLIRSFFVVLRVRPDVVVGFGGYSSGTISLAAKLSGAALVIHEQNVVPGKANVILSRFADKIALSFSGPVPGLERFSAKTVFTGNPIRADILSSDRQGSASRLGIPWDRSTVLVMGGSQGSRFLNRELSEVALKVKERRGDTVQFVHITGRGEDNKSVAEFYEKNGIPGKVFSFMERIDDAYAVSDIAVSRAGAAAIFELAYYGRPMILVPYPSSGNSQISNALFFASRGAALCRQEKDLSQETLTHDILEILDNPDKYAAMREAALKLALPHSGRILAEEVIALAAPARYRDPCRNGSGGECGNLNSKT